MKWLLTILLLAIPVAADQLIDEYSVNLLGDRERELVGLRPIEKDGVTLGQLVVTDRRGRVLWEAPTDDDRYLFLGPYDHGGLEALYTHVGKVYLMGSYQHSDVRPTRFRQFVWTGEGFQIQREGHLLALPESPNIFQWGYSLEATRWLDSFTGLVKGNKLGAVVVNVPDPPDETRVRVQSDTYVLSR